MPPARSWPCIVSIVIIVQIFYVTYLLRPLLKQVFHLYREEILRHLDSYYYA